MRLEIPTCRLNNKNCLLSVQEYWLLPINSGRNHQDKFMMGLKHAFAFVSRLVGQPYNIFAPVYMSVLKTHYLHPFNSAADLRKNK